MFTAEEVVTSVTETVTGLTGDGPSDNTFHLKVQVRVMSVPTAEMAVSYCLVIFGLVGNLLNVLVLSSLKPNAVFVYLKALAGFDMISCVSMGFVLYHRLIGALSTRYTYEWFHTYIVLPLILTVPYISSCITLIISFLRFILVKFPVKGKSLSSMTPVRYFISAATCFVVCIRMPIIYKSVKMNIAEVQPGITLYQQSWSLWLTDEGRNAWLALAAIFDFSLCLLLIIFSMLMLITLWQHKKQMGNILDKKSRKEEWELQIILMVTSVVVLQSVCMAPTSLIRLLPIPKALRVIILAICNQFYILNYSINFYMYLANHPWFRKATRKLLCRRWDMQVGSTDVPLSTLSGSLNNRPRHAVSQSRM